MVYPSSYWISTINQNRVINVDTSDYEMMSISKLYPNLEGVKAIDCAITDDEATKLGRPNSDKILKWSSSDLSNQNLSNIKGDTYVVFYDLDNPNNCEVYYLNGYEGNYSLTQLQGL